MATGNVANYRGNSSPERLIQNGMEFVQVYNNSGGALSNGAIKVVSPIWITGLGVVYAPIAPATEATESNEVGIINNSPKGLATIADTAYGWMQVYGTYGDVSDVYGVATSGTVTANMQLEVLNTGTAFIDAGVLGGVVLEAETVAIAEELVTTNIWKVFLLGRKNVHIKAA